MDNNTKESPQSLTLKKLIYTLLFTLLLAQFETSYSKEGHRPKIGLVLSGGGARGAAHIGVIEVLEEYNIPIDYIVGTSMGAVIGGLYASGVPIQKIKHDFLSLNWEEIFKEDVIRQDLYFRRKLDTDIFLIRNLLWFNNGIHVSSGLINGQQLYLYFSSYLLPLKPVQSFQQLPIPFKAVSTDLISGKSIILENGDLSMAMLASMAVPGIISPIDVPPYLLVDGGVRLDLPIEVAKAMGADIVIVVDVSTPLSRKDQITNFYTVLIQISNILTDINIKKSESYLTSQDIFIKPELTDIDTINFDKFDQAIGPGKIAARAQKDKLIALSNKSEVIKRPIPPENSLIAIDKVEIINGQPLCHNTYLSYLRFDSPEVQSSQIIDHMSKLYGLYIFDRLYFNIEETDDTRTLVVKPKVVSPDNIYLQGSLLFNIDSQGNNNITMLAGLTNTQVNSLLGEWRILGLIGQTTGAYAEFYQPLTPSLSWFINPYMQVDRTKENIYFDYDQIAVFQVTSDAIGIKLGRIFSTWGQLYAYYQMEYDDIKIRSGIPTNFDLHNRDAEIGLRFEVDTFDNLFFPHSGVIGRLNIAQDSRDYGGENNFSQLISNIYVAAFHYNKHTLLAGGQYNRTLHGQPSFTSQFTLGGLFELSGLVEDELTANNIAVADLIYFYEVSTIKILNKACDIYIGASIEAGRAWGESNLSDDKSVISSGSLFLGLDTFIGPVFLSVAVTDNGHRAAQLILRPWFRQTKFKAVAE